MVFDIVGFGIKKSKKCEKYYIILIGSYTKNAPVYKKLVFTKKDDGVHFTDYYIKLRNAIFNLDEKSDYLVPLNKFISFLIEEDGNTIKYHNRSECITSLYNKIEIEKLKMYFDEITIKDDYANDKDFSDGEYCSIEELENVR